MEVVALPRRRLLAVISCAGVRPALAARRRGAKLCPGKETTAEMSAAKAFYWDGLTGAKDKSGKNPAGNDLHIKFADVIIDYSKYHL
jgi:hypothetical protein